MFPIFVKKAGADLASEMLHVPRSPTPPPTEPQGACWHLRRRPGDPGTDSSALSGRRKSCAAFTGQKRAHRAPWGPHQAEGCSASEAGSSPMLSADVHTHALMRRCEYTRVQKRVCTCVCMPADVHTRLMCRCEYFGTHTGVQKRVHTRVRAYLCAHTCACLSVCTHHRLPCCLAVEDTPLPALHLVSVAAPP